MLYPYLLIVHLLCASAFIGVVFFEVFLLEGMRKYTDADIMEKLEAGLVHRARKIMPFVVAALFLTGIYLGYTQFKSQGLNWSNSFTVLLSIKIILALSILVHFVTAMFNAARGCMSSTAFKLTHISVLTHMVLIVILAKAMFYFSW